MSKAKKTVTIRLPPDLVKFCRENKINISEAVAANLFSAVTDTEGLKMFKEFFEDRFYRCHGCMTRGLDDAWMLEAVPRGCRSLLEHETANGVLITGPKGKGVCSMWCRECLAKPAKEVMPEPFHDVDESWLEVITHIADGKPGPKGMRFEFYHARKLVQHCLRLRVQGLIGVDNGKSDEEIEKDIEEDRKRWKLKK